MTRRDLDDSMPDDDLSAKSIDPTASIEQSANDSTIDEARSDEEADAGDTSGEIGTDDAESPEASAFLNAVSASLNAQDKTDSEAAHNAADDGSSNPAVLGNDSTNAADSKTAAKAEPAQEELRRSSGKKFDFGPRRLPPPTPFEQLVMDMSAARRAGPSPPSAAPEASPPVHSAFAPSESRPSFALSPSIESAAGAFTVNVQVSLTDEAIRRVAEAAVRELAGVSHKQLEIVAKRLFDLDQEIFAREANRRALYRY